MESQRRLKNQLSIRKRGPRWHVRGTVTAQGDKRIVNEHSTGETDEAAAWAYVHRLEERIRYEIVYGETPPSDRTQLNFSDGIIALLEANTPNSSELYVLKSLTHFFGDYLLSDITAETWNAYLKDRLPGRATGTQVRHAVIFRNVFNAVIDQTGIEPPKIKSSVKRKRLVRWLPTRTADDLCDAYAPHAKPIALTLRYTGMRTQEVLQLQRSNIDLASNSILVPPSKNGQARSIPIHPKLAPILEAALRSDRPAFIRDGQRTDPVFLTHRGLPYPDTRKTSGGNPFRTAHTTACRRAGVENFRVHDWRHHWASWAMHEGATVADLMLYGGWSDPSMVMTYAGAIPSKQSADRFASVA